MTYFRLEIYKKQWLELCLSIMHDLPDTLPDIDWWALLSLSETALGLSKLLNLGGLHIPGIPMYNSRRLPKCGLFTENLNLSNIDNWPTESYFLSKLEQFNNPVLWKLMCQTFEAMMICTKMDHMYKNSSMIYSIWRLHVFNV